MTRYLGMSPVGVGCVELFKAVPLTYAFLLIDLTALSISFIVGSFFLEACLVTVKTASSLSSGESTERIKFSGLIFFQLLSK